MEKSEVIQTLVIDITSFHSVKITFLFVLDMHRFHCYNAFNVYCRELAPGTVSLIGDRAQGDDSKHCAYSKYAYILSTNISVTAHCIRPLLPVTILTHKNIDKEIISNLA